MSNAAQSFQPGGPAQAKPSTDQPSMREQLQQRRTQLLTELRDVEQAIEQIEANPNFETVMRTLLRAHKMMY